MAVGTAFFFGRRLRAMTTGVQDRVAEATAVAEEAFSQIRTVQSFVQEPDERARYGDRIRAVVQTAVRRAQVRGVFFGALTLAGFGAMVVVLWQGGLLVLEGKLTAGALFSFLLYTITIAGAVGALASFFSSLPGIGGRGGAGVRAPGDAPGPPSPIRRAPRSRLPSAGARGRIGVRGASRFRVPATRPRTLPGHSWKI